MGVVADLVQATVWVFLAMTLYLLLKHVHQSAAFAMVVLVALGAGIACLNAVFEFEGLRVATGAVTRPSGSNGTGTYCEDMGGAFLAGLAQKCTGPSVPG
ncbi:MAG: DUF4386 domain-containing protein, partial [Candidatus Dormibacteraeota bacterium]|nr:DUF4386 domain-containing protein [Candidatus Dormibacteraeota bacterium]